MTRNMIYHNDNGNLMYDVKERDWREWGLSPREIRIMTL